MQIKFARRQNVARQPNARVIELTRDNFAFQNRVRVVVAHDPICAVLLELLDDRVGHEHFDARDQCLVLERRDRDGVNVTQIIWLGRPDVITEATTQNRGRLARPRKTFSRSRRGSRFR